VVRKTAIRERTEMKRVTWKSYPHCTAPEQGTDAQSLKEFPPPKSFWGAFPLCE
jgi:hypothetical protein